MARRASVRSRWSAPSGGRRSALASADFIPYPGLMTRANLVALQRSAGNAAVASMLRPVQRDADTQTDPGPGVQQTAHAPSFRVKIVGHASPRWRSAKNAADASRRNLELSQRRTQAVATEVEQLLAKNFPSGVSVNVDTSVLNDGDVGVSTEAHGSHDTLIEAKGDRNDNALLHRRVDVVIESSQRISGTAGATNAQDVNQPTASKFWHLNVGVSAGATFGLSVGYLALQLTNDLTGRTVDGHVFVGGGGLKAGVGAGYSVWSDPTGFSTDEPVDFDAFDNNVINYSSAGVTAFIGYSQSYFSFTGLGSGAKLIDISGAQVGSVGFGASSATGSVTLDKPLPPKSVAVHVVDDIVVPFERTDSGSDAHKVLFETGDSTISKIEGQILDSFVAGTVGNRGF